MRSCFLPFFGLALAVFSAAVPAAAQEPLPLTILYQDMDGDGDFSRVATYVVPTDVALADYAAFAGSAFGESALFGRSATDEWHEAGAGDQFAEFLAANYPIVPPALSADCPPCDAIVQAKFDLSCPFTCVPETDCTNQVQLTFHLNCLNVPPCPAFKNCRPHAERITSITTNKQVCVCIDDQGLPKCAKQFGAKVIEFTSSTPICECESAFVYFNEIYGSHAGTDNLEFIELISATPGIPLTNLMVLIVEGDGAAAGTLDFAVDLSGIALPPTDLYPLIGNTAVPGIDLDLGPSNAIENGTQTYYLLDAGNPATVVTVLGLLGTNVSSGPNSTILSEIGTIVDRVAQADAGYLTGVDTIFDFAEPVGPDLSFLPAGMYRGGDFPNPWCSAFLDFDPLANQLQPRTPGAPNAPCRIHDFGEGCEGSGLIVPRLQIAGDTSPGGQVTLSILDGLGGSFGVVFLSTFQGPLPLGYDCDFLLGVPFFSLPPLPLAGAGPGQGSISLSGAIPPAAPPLTLFFQALVADPGVPPGYSTTQGTSLQVP